MPDRGWVVAAGGSGGGTPATVAELSDIHIHTDRHTDRQTDIDIFTDSQTARQPDSQTTRHPDRPVLYHTLMRHSLVY
ncbi:hypothetical protein M433DRAFT_160824 [Acidomyces richmondensis BFW]|nr:hypothetical protein M433DRAFT_160824 [Acidomyces richmondensis BFW]